MKEKYDFSQGKRGAVDPIPLGKTRITIRIDDDVLDWFRGEVHAAGGGNYQTLINHALREYVQSRKQPLEQILRRVVQEELSAWHEGSRRESVLYVREQVAPTLTIQHLLAQVNEHNLHGEVDTGPAMGKEIW